MEGTLPSYLDQNHEFFAPELEAGVKARQRLFIEGEYQENLVVSEQIKDCLRENRPKIAESNEALTRLSTFCNPNQFKKGYYSGKKKSKKNRFFKREKNPTLKIFFHPIIHFSPTVYATKISPSTHFPL